MKKSPSRKQVYDIVTARFIESLKKGKIPWRMPWKSNSGTPRSWDGRPYHGINALITYFTCIEKEYEHPIFLTLKKINDLGGTLRKGEKSTLVTLWRRIIPKEYADNPEDCPEEEIHWVLRYYLVFNVAQCEDLPPLPISAEPNPDFSPIDECENIVYGYDDCPPIKHLGNRAAYAPIDDEVLMPKPTAFTSDESYYASLFHELIHSTGHPSRLDRPDLTDSLAKFGTPTYAKEELTAEIGASFLCNIAGISSPALEENSEAYIQSWIKRLEKDPRLIITAANRAQKAADYILG